MNTTRNKTDGRFSYEGNWDRLCKCGHPLRAHLAAAPHDCDNANWGNGEECGCSRFKPAK